MILDFRFDEGQGWGVVPVSSLADLDLLDKVSNYSYIDNDNAIVYLEENCDLVVYIETLKKMFNIKIDYNFIDDGEYSPIRNLERYSY